VVIPKCWEEFSRIVRRGEFVNLGLVLCAVVARVASCLGETENVGDDLPLFGEETISMRDDDLGEAIVREEFDGTIQFEEENSINDSFASSKQDTPPFSLMNASTDKAAVSQSKQTRDENNVREVQRPLKRKRRKKGHEIDDIFAQLG
jgi:hypothetical protein